MAMFFIGLVLGLLIMDVYRDRVEMHEKQSWLELMEQFEKERKGETIHGNHQVE